MMKEFPKKVFIYVIHPTKDGMYLEVATDIADIAEINRNVPIGIYELKEKRIVTAKAKLE